MGKERKYRPWSPQKSGTTQSCPCNGPDRTFFGCQQLPGAAEAPDTKATGSCHSCSAHRPREATADNTLQVFSPRTKALFSACREGRSLLAGWKMAFLDGNIWLQYDLLLQKKSHRREGNLTQACKKPLWGLLSASFFSPKY